MNVCAKNRSCFAFAGLTQKGALCGGGSRFKVALQMHTLYTRTYLALYHSMHAQCTHLLTDCKVCMIHLASTHVGPLSRSVPTAVSTFGASGNSGQEHLVLAADQTSKKDRAFDCQNMKQLSLEETEQTSNQHAHATTVLCAGVFVFDGLSTFSRRP